MSEKDLVERALRLLDEYGAGGGKPARRMLSPEEVRAHNEKAREDLDHFFTAAVMPGLTRIHAEGKLPTLDVPEWEPIDREWAKASEGPRSLATRRRLRRECGSSSRRGAEP